MYVDLITFCFVIIAMSTPLNNCRAYETYKKTSVSSTAPSI